MQLPDELDERCRAGTPSKQAFGAKATAERPRREVTAWVRAGEQPPFRIALCGIDELDDGVAEDLGGERRDFEPATALDHNLTISRIWLGQK